MIDPYTTKRLIRDHAPTLFKNGLLNALNSPQTAAPPSVVLKNVGLYGATRVFAGHIEVLRAANGYLVQIGRTEAGESEVYIAPTIADVNDIITAQMVVFRLEDNS